MSTNPARQFYDRISSVYDLIADKGEHSARERGVAMLAVEPGDQVLEVGFGTGHALVALAGQVGSEGLVCGIDLSPGMLSVASRRVGRASLEDRIELQCGEAPPLPYEDGKFDAAFLSFTLELFPLGQIPELLAEIGRVLKPGGHLGVVSMATVLPGETESALEKSYKWMHRHFPHIVDCQPIEVEHHVRAAGYELLASERISLFTLPVAVIVGRNSS